MTCCNTSALSRRSALLGGAATVLGTRFAFAADPTPPKLLVCVFLRGAVDGLSLVVPHAERAYYAERPTIAVPRPKQRDGAVDLDGRFGLHPRLAPLKAAFDAGELGVVSAVGSPRATRSHFEAQDDMETATPGVRRRDGWIGRSLATVPRADTELRGMALGPREPLALRGMPHVLSAPSLDRVKLRAPERQRELLEAAFLDMYAEGSPAAERAGHEALLLARRLRELDPERYQPENGAEYAKNASAFRDVALLSKASVGLEVAWIDLGGWDTHQGQGNADRGRLPPLLEGLGGGLAAFRRDLGPRFENVLVLVMSEFGRTLRENGTGGTDHGHGSAMLLLGGGVRGKKVHGRFPGLEKEQLFEERDLAVTTDFREVFAEVLERHLGVANVGAALPGYARDAAHTLGLLR